ncbi:hypothetical protein [Rhodococcus kronopolitis]|uniref:DUF5615 domain-containing protein n=1 Tax=Rhodococcus kronopolitis TaxID=1460226 RepID=A0ABV9FR57_9NOCA
MTKPDRRTAVQAIWSAPSVNEAATGLCRGAARPSVYQPLVPGIRRPVTYRRQRRLRGRVMEAQDSRIRLLFIGHSSTMSDIWSWAAAQGYETVDTVDSDTSYAIATDDVLDGRCSPTDADLLAAAEDAEVPILNARHARDLVKATPPTCPQRLPRPTGMSARPEGLQSVERAG